MIPARLAEVRTVAELEALPESTILIDSYGRPWWFGEPSDDGWRLFHSPERKCYAERLVTFYGPLAVAWRPE